MNYRARRSCIIFSRVHNSTLLRADSVVENDVTDYYYLSRTYAAYNILYECAKYTRVYYGFLLGI